VLTAENLRGEIADLWENGNFPAESVICVTHNIEEAIILADRLVILGTNPGRVRGEIKVTMPRPRERSSKDFRAFADHVYTIMTNPETKVAFVSANASGFDTSPLPHARPGAISGLLELVEEYGGPEDVAVISDKLRIEADDLLPILDAAVQLNFAKVQDGDVTLTEVGKRFANAEVEEARQIFRTQAMELAPLLRCIVDTLSHSRGGSMKSDFFLDILDESYSNDEAEAQFNTAVTWGRYAGLFEFDSDDQVLRLQTSTSETN
jgi:NitT/TauT family transport system ATP-binding protein